MNIISNTLESDAAEIVQTFKGLPDCRTGRVHIQVARKLELERDELKAFLIKDQGVVTISRNGYVEELESKLGEHKLESADMRFTVEEIAQYISGWAMSPFDSVRKIGQYVLQNALSQLECDQDGIAAVIRHRRAHSDTEKQ